MSYLVLLTVPLVSIAFGYIYGRKHIDPNTPEGHVYYSTGEST